MAPPTDLDTEGARLRARGWTFDVSQRSRSSHFHGSALAATGPDAPSSIYVSGKTPERVTRALLDAALALTGNPWGDAA